MVAHALSIRDESKALDLLGTADKVRAVGQWYVSEYGLYCMAGMSNILCKVHVKIHAPVRGDGMSFIWTRTITIAILREYREFTDE